MTITARVRHGAIELPAGTLLPEGAELTLVLPDPPSSTPAIGPSSFFDSIRDLVGAAAGLPEDFAAEHDHYIHGTHKRAAP